MNLPIPKKEVLSTLMSIVVVLAIFTVVAVVAVILIISVHENKQYQLNGQYRKFKVYIVAFIEDQLFLSLCSPVLFGSLIYTDRSFV